MNDIDVDMIPPEDYVPMRRLPPMPAEIAAAIVQIEAAVKSLPKDEKHKQGWKYVSVDAFWEAIGPLMAAAGIFSFVDEVESEIVRRESTDERGDLRVTNWLTSKYEITIYTQTGVSWGPIRRAMSVVASGPQAYGGGLSFVEKYFLRGLFKVPTGDGDADAEPQEALPARNRPPPRPARPRPLPQPQTGVVLTPTNADGEPLGPHTLTVRETDRGRDYPDFGGRFIAAIRAASTLEDIDAWEDANELHINQAPPGVFRSISGALEAYRKELANKAPLVTEADAATILQNGATE